MSLILALDQGTTSTKAHLVNEKAQIIYTAQKEIGLILPKDAYVEQDPEEIWNSVVYCLKQAAKEAKKLKKQILTIGITNQRETTLVWHKKTGKTIYNAISWQDSRTGDSCKRYSKRNINYISKKTGLLLNPYFSGTKLKWLIENKLKGKNLDNYAFGTIDSFLVYRLTGGKIHATDTSNASRTLIFDIKKVCFDDKLLKLFHVKKTMLPEVKNSSDDYGITDKKIFGQEIPISSVIGDQQAATIGHCCFKSGEAKATYGTGCFVMVNTGKKIVKSKFKLLATILYSHKGKTEYALEGSVFYAGSALNWARDNLKLFKDFDSAERAIAKLKDNGGVYVVPALSGLGAPHWDDRARGIITGLNNKATDAHIARAVFESIAYQTNDLMAAIAKDGFKIKKLQIDGGMSKNNWFNQFLSEIIGAPVNKANTAELTSLGAAYLAGLKIGYFKSFSEISKLHKIAKSYSPKKLSKGERAKLLSDWSRAIKLCLIK